MSELQTLRDYEETRMLVEELRLRYPGGVPGALVDQLAGTLNVNPIITQEMIRREVTALEGNLNLNPTTPALAPPGNNKEAFVRLLEGRRGAYNWVGGTTQVFTNWINGANPVANPLPINAQINCWEVVLAAAVESGLLSVQQVQLAYAALDKTQAVSNLLTANGFTVINNPTVSQGNGIQRGDVIMIDGAADGLGELHHVVVALGANQGDHLQVPILSLWSLGGGGSLARRRLDDFVNGNVDKIRYASL